MAPPFCTTLVFLAKHYKWLFWLLRKRNTVGSVSGILEWYDYGHLIEPVGDSVAVTLAYAFGCEISGHNRKQLLVVTLCQKGPTTLPYSITSSGSMPTSSMASIGIRVSERNAG